MPARIDNPAFVVPGAMDALQALGAAVGNGGVPETTINLVLMRASQINGCGVCLEGHTRHARKDGETDERLATIAAWRETPYFTDAERAALALTEAVTRLGDRSDPVPDAVFAEAGGALRRAAARHARARDREHQRVEPAQRRHRPGGRRGRVVTEATDGTA